MDINLADVEQLIKLAERSNIESLEVTDGDKRIVVVCYDSSKTSQASHDNHNTANSTTPSTDLDQHSTRQSIDNEDASVTEPTRSDFSTIIAPMMGTFYLRSEPSAEVFVSEGDSVTAGDTLCIIEAMKIMHEVKADADGVIDKILIKEGDVVEFDQPLFEIRPV